MIARQLSIVILLSIFTSCSTSYFITVRQNGSASVDIDKDYNPTVIKKHYQSDVISNIDTNLSLAGRETFEISNIDSLGDYLPFHPPGFFSFSMEGNTLIVTDSHTDAFRDNNCCCCAVYMFLKFDSDIRRIESINKVAKKKDDRTVLIMKSRRQLIKGKKKTDVTIKIE